MPVATCPRFFSFRLLPLLVAALGLVSSCQSSRPGFAFQPAPPRGAWVERAGAAAVPADSAVSSAVTAVPAAPASHAVLPARGRTARKARTARVAPKATAAVAPTRRPAAVVRQRPLLHRPHGTAEAGLGTTVLGVLGLIALPIALIGLAISGGGLVWAIVAGAAALAVLVAYLDPFGG